MNNEQVGLSATVLTKNLQKKHTIKNTALLIFGFLILAVAYFYMFRTVPRQSDLANTLLAGYDMSKGNWRLHGWWLGADNFLTTDIVYYAFLTKLFGLNPQIMFYLPAMLWAGVALLSIALAHRASSKNLTQPAVAAAAAATPILLPIIRDHPGMSQIAQSPMHIGTIAYILLSFFFLKKLLAGRSPNFKIMLGVYSLLLLSAVFADPLAIFAGALPAIAVAGFSGYHLSNRRHIYIVLATTVLAVFFGRMLVTLISSIGGFQPCTRVSLNFVKFDELGNNIGITINDFFILFGCDFFGKAISPTLMNGAVLALIRLPFLILLIIALAQVTKKFIVSMKVASHESTADEGAYLDALLAAALTFNVLSAIFSPQLLIDPVMTIRYFFPALVFGAILCARLCRSTWIGAYYYVAFVASLAFTAMAYVNKGTGINSEIEALSTWLSGKGLTNGFGPYWSSSIVTAETRNRIKIRALISDGLGKMKPFEFMAKRNWYKALGTRDKAVFVLVHDTPQVDYYSETDVITTLGEPSQRYHVGSYIVNVYDPANERFRLLSITSTDNASR